MKITLTSKLRHGILYEGVKRFGSATKFAEYLGVQGSLLGQWINLKSVPSEKMSLRIEVKLADLFNLPVEDIFPPELHSVDFLDRNKNFEITKDIPLEMLIEFGLTTKALASPEDDFFDKEKQDVIRSVLSTLSPREALIIDMRFGLNGKTESTLKEIGDEIGICRARVGQIEAKALRKLRHRTISGRLKEFK